MQFLRRELVEGLSVLIGLAAFFGAKFKFTPVVIGLLAFGALWTLVVVGWAVYEKLPWELRRKGASDLPDWLEGLPYYLNPKNDRRWCANHLIQGGDSLLTMIPKKEPPSELIQALSGTTTAARLLQGSCVLGARCQNVSRFARSRLSSTVP